MDVIENTMVGAASRNRAGGRRPTLTALPGGAPPRHEAAPPIEESPELGALLEQVERAVLWAYASDQPVELSFLVARGLPGARITARVPEASLVRAADLHAEQDLLGLLIYDNDVLKVIGPLERSDFWVPLHGRLYACIADLVAHDELAEPIQLDKRFASDPEYGALGGLRYVADLIADAPEVSAAQGLAGRIRELAGQRPVEAATSGAYPDDLQTALSEARARGAKRAAEILAEPAMLGADAFARLLGTTRETVRQRLQKREVLGLQGAKRGIRYPAWQVLDDGRLLPGLPDLFARLGDSPWTVFRFLTQPNPALAGATPLERLRGGDAAAVLDAAGAQARGDFG